MTARLSPMRTGRVTGSRVGAIIGVNRYQKPGDVMRVMVREHHGAPSEFAGNEATEWGTFHEEDARVAYEQATGCLVTDAQEFICHPVYPDLLGVSPDGLVGPVGLVEFKSPYRARYTSIGEKPDYQAQVQLQLACTGREWCDFVVWRPWAQADRLGVDPLIIERVDVDPEWLPTHLPTLQAFHSEYLRVTADPDLAAMYLDDADVVPDGWSDAAARWIELDEQVRAFTVERDAARDLLVSLAGDRNVTGAGLSVSRTERAGTVDYKAIVAKHVPDVDVNDYRKAVQPVWTVRQSTPSIGGAA
jgi:putative phage-type endonuclease